jgi:hypothetical protein
VARADDFSRKFLEVEFRAQDIAIKADKRYIRFSMSLRKLAIRPSNARAVSLALTTSHAPRLGIRFSSTAPATIVDGSFWRSLVPKPLRKENRQLKKKSREWNPATFFIAIFLLIGSMSIQMIALRNSFDRYMRQSEARIMALREVVEKIQRGEPVDVEKALGTGDPKKEADWEESKSTSSKVNSDATTNSSLQC